METNAAHSLLAMAEAAAAGLTGLDARTWLERLEGSLGELQSGFEWLLIHDRTGALRMATGLAGFWRLSGRIPEGRAWLDQASAAADPDDAAMPRALYQNALLAFWQGDDAVTRSLLERSLGMARRRRDTTGEATALCGMARVELREGNLDRARGLCDEALERVRGTDDKVGRSNALHVLGVTAQMRGDLEVASGFMSQRMELARELGQFSSVAGEACNLSVVERQLGNLERATQLALEALQLSDRRGDEWMIPYELSSLAGIAAAKTDFARAAKLLGAAAAMMERMGTAWPPDEKPHFDATRSAAEAGLGPGAFEQAWADGERMPPSDAVALALSAGSIT